MPCPCKQLGVCDLSGMEPSCPGMAAMWDAPLQFHPKPFTAWGHLLWMLENQCKSNMTAKSLDRSMLEAGSHSKPQQHELKSLSYVMHMSLGQQIAWWPITEHSFASVKDIYRHHQGSKQFKPHSGPARGTAALSEWKVDICISLSESSYCKKKYLRWKTTPSSRNVQWDA